jgi:hypothetical protein
MVFATVEFADLVALASQLGAGYGTGSGSLCVLAAPEGFMGR